MIGCVWEIVAIAFGWPTWTQIHHRLSRHRVLWLVAWFWDGGWDDHFRRRFP